MTTTKNTLAQMRKHERGAVREALQAIEDGYRISRTEYRLLVGFGLVRQSFDIEHQERCDRTRLGFRIGEALGVRR